MNSEYVYFDHNSTTPIDPRVLEDMWRFFGTNYGNASSRHELGTVALTAVESAREQVAGLVGVEKKQVIFTSGGTEANNFVIKGFGANREPGIVAISSIEHPCVKKAAFDLVRHGWEVVQIPVTDTGVTKVSDVEEVLEQKIGLISVMTANNETGVCQPVKQISNIARRKGVFVHTDAVQALGKIPVSFEELGVNGMSISAHKLNGPKGIGALILDKKSTLQPLINGGGHEDGMRSGTLNVPAIVGFGVACELAKLGLSTREPSSSILRQYLEEKLSSMGAIVFGHEEKRLPNTSYFTMPGIFGETLVIELDKCGFAVSSGAACSSNSDGPSEVLSAMRVEEETSLGAVRVSFGINNTKEQVDKFTDELNKIVKRLGAMSAIAV